MVNALIILMILSGIIFAGTVMLMNPKGGLGVIGGLSGGIGGNEYGSKKSLESTLKRTATVSGIIFVCICIVLPYMS